MKTRGSDNGGRSGCVIALRGRRLGRQHAVLAELAGCHADAGKCHLGRRSGASDVPQDATISTASAVTRTPRRGGRCDMGWTQSTAGSPETQVTRCLTAAEASSEPAADGATWQGGRHGDHCDEGLDRPRHRGAPTSTPRSAFYRDTLGFAAVGETPMPGGSHMYRLMCGTSMIKLITHDPVPEAAAPRAASTVPPATATGRSRSSNVAEIVATCEAGGYKVVVAESPSCGPASPSPSSRTRTATGSSSSQIG